MTDTLRHQLDELARHAPAPRWPHDVAAKQAWSRGRRLLVPAPLVAVVVICSLVLLVGLGALAIVRRTPVQPARGSGALPARVVVPPLGTPLVTEQPVERAAYVIAGEDLRRGTFSRGIAPVVVSADDGQYRVVPWHDGDHGISLSPDGRRLAWVVGESPRVTRVVVLTLATGAMSEVPDAPSAAEGTAWSDDGTRLLVWGLRRVSEYESQDAHVEVRDARTLRLLWRVDGHGSAAMVHGSVVVPQQEATVQRITVRVDRAVVSPDGTKSAQVVLPADSTGPRSDARLAVDSVAAPGAMSLRSMWLTPAPAYAEALAWSADGVVAARYGGAERHVAPVVQVLDPATGRVVRTLTSLPDDAAPGLAVDIVPQVLAVAADVLAAGQVADTRPRTWPWYSAERVRWWVSDPVRAGLQIGLALMALFVGVALVHMMRRA
jgi:WD40-like Beta Propeller Repeat